MESVSIRELKANPFQARQSIDQQKVRELADEIRDQGFWESPLRARRLNGRLELVFGHRRLEALKLLGHKTVNVEVVDLDDTAMATQALVENVQRMGLTDVEKANAIQHLLTSGRPPLTIKKVAELLGYSELTVKEYKRLAELGTETKKAVQKADMSRTAVHTADAIGGEAFIQLAAKANFNRDDLREIQAEAAKLQPLARKKFQDQVKTGKYTKRENIKNVARRLHVDQIKREVKAKRTPPDLHDVLIKWTLFIKQWRRELREVAPYRDYIDEDPDSAFLFRKEVRGLITDLQALL